MPCTAALCQSSCTGAERSIQHAVLERPETSNPGPAPCHAPDRGSRLPGSHNHLPLPSQPTLKPTSGNAFELGQPAVQRRLPALKPRPDAAARARFLAAHAVARRPSLRSVARTEGAVAARVLGRSRRDCQPPAAARPWRHCRQPQSCPPGTPNHPHHTWPAAWPLPLRFRSLRDPGCGERLCRRSRSCGPLAVKGAGPAAAAGGAATLRNTGGAVVNGRSTRPRSNALELVSLVSVGIDPVARALIAGLAVARKTCPERAGMGPGMPGSRPVAWRPAADLIASHQDKLMSPLTRMHAWPVGFCLACSSTAARLPWPQPRLLSTTPCHPQPSWGPGFPSCVASPAMLANMVSPDHADFPNLHALFSCPDTFT